MCASPSDKEIVFSVLRELYRGIHWTCQDAINMKTSLVGLSVMPPECLGPEPTVKLK